MEQDSTDYAADNSSDHSSSATPHTQSPRHRATTICGSPLARPLFRNNKQQSISKEMLTLDGELPSTSQTALDVLHVNFFHLNLKYQNTLTYYDYLVTGRRNSKETRSKP